MSSISISDPLGRQIQSKKPNYMYQGDQFTCFNYYSEVLELPKINVGEFIKRQHQIIADFRIIIATLEFKNHIIKS